MIESPEEYKLDKAIERWHDLDVQAKKAKEEADQVKRDIIGQMHQLGLKSQESHVGRLTLSPYRKCNIVGSNGSPAKNRAEFEAMLKREGLYDRFTEVKFSLDKVKDYCIDNDDDLHGMVEIETDYKITFTSRGNE